MPLRDHFQPPLSERRHWQAFHNAWATSIAASLNQRLPQDYFAEPNVRFGIEVDVAAFAERTSSPPPHEDGCELWTPPEPAHTIPLLLEEDAVEVHVYSTAEGPVLVPAIELVSPSSKDRQEYRDAFLAKCEAYLHQGIGLVMVDIVTNRTGNLHDELMQRLHDRQAAQVTCSLYATAYRPVGQNGQTSLQIWTSVLELGARLPSMPLWLRSGPCMPVELETAYQCTCTEQRIV